VSGWLVVKERLAGVGNCLKKGKEERKRRVEKYKTHKIRKHIINGASKCADISLAK
jgi:hypothetical protein